MALKTDGVFELTGQVDPYFTRRGGGFKRICAFQKNVLHETKSRRILL